MRWLALDLGDRRIGVARTDIEGRVALPDRVIAHPGSEETLIRQVADLAVSLSAEGIVVGLPRNMNGSEGPRALAARRFATRLAEETGLAVELWDERLTTRQAERQGVAADLSRRRRRRSIDRVAATLILESFLGARRAKIHLSGPAPSGEG